MIDHPERRLQIAVGKFVRSAVTAAHYFECYDRGMNDPDGRRHLWEATRHVKAGTPDTALIVAGRVFRVELKSGTKKPTERQWDRIREIQAAGAKAGWANSVERYGELLEAWQVPLAPNWRLQAQHLDARLEVPRSPAKAKAPFRAKPPASRIRAVSAVYRKYMP
jgi:hypothetical protein